ncbi:MAG: hypothetical protein HYV60_15675 [Planctomycetia bacterium]|nr:hypothetical protein [Planctomycetia bacterium]
MKPKLSRTRQLPRYTLRVLLAVVALSALPMAVIGYRQRQRELAIQAYQAMSAKGVDGRFPGKAIDHMVIFKNGNVTDHELETFAKAFNGYAPHGFGKITALDLCGSPVAAEAVERFKSAVPDCELLP